MNHQNEVTDKWNDDIPLQPLGSVQPTTVAALLRSQRATHATDEGRTAVINRWLKTNTPSETLANSLRRQGYAQLLESKAKDS